MIELRRIKMSSADNACPAAGFALSSRIPTKSGPVDSVSSSTCSAGTKNINNSSQDNFPEYVQLVRTEAIWIRRVVVPLQAIQHMRTPAIKKMSSRYSLSIIVVVYRLAT